MYSVLAAWLLLVSIGASTALPQVRSDDDIFLGDDPGTLAPSQDGGTFDKAVLLGLDDDQSKIGLFEAQHTGVNECEADADSFPMIGKRGQDSLECPIRAIIAPPEDPKTRSPTIPGRVPSTFPKGSPSAVTNDNSMEDRCSHPLMKDSKIPVCGSGHFARDAMRLPGADSYTIFNIRHCTVN